MENFIVPLAREMRVARKSIALILAVVALGAIPSRNALAQAAPAQNSIVNFPANNPPNAPVNGAPPAYNPGDPLYIDTQKILQNAQSQQTPAPLAKESQAIAPPEVLAAEMQQLNQRLGSCEGASSCSARNRLQILTDSSNALHESLLRINTVCTIMGADACLSQQYSQLQQWAALNDRMGTMLHSVVSTAGTAQTLLLSQGTPPAGSELNNMEPAAGSAGTNQSPPVTKP